MPTASLMSRKRGSFSAKKQSSPSSLALSNTVPKMSARHALLALLSPVLFNSCGVTDANTARTRNHAVIGGTAGGIIGKNTSIGTGEGIIAGAVLGGVLTSLGNPRPTTQPGRYSRYNYMRYQF